VVIISDDEEDPMIVEDVPEDEESMATPTPTLAPTPVAALVPAPTLAVAPVHATASAVTPSSATSPTPVPSLAVQVVDKEMCWKRKYYFKPAPETAYYHTLLTRVLDDYYPDLHASIKYLWSTSIPWRLPTGRRTLPSAHGMISRIHMR
jgi:hypothetical protein